MGPSQKNTLSRVSVIQPKALHFHYFILKVPCFPSIFWSTANDNYYIAGSIPSPFLSGLCIEDGLSHIPNHVCSRLINASSSTSSDYCYPIFGHDLMFSIAADHCDMHQHRKEITLSNTADGGLDLRCKDDSIFFHSIDSRQMLKTLCASQEYFQWDILLTFTCNMRFFLQNQFANV